MKIEDIIYQTTREVLNVEDKLKIAAIFIFCQQLGSKELSELLYCDNHIEFISKLQKEFSGYEVDLTIDFDNKNVKSAFFKTLQKVKEKWDENGYLKALYEGDSFALVISEISKVDFDGYKFQKKLLITEQQLKLF